MSILQKPRPPTTWSAFLSTGPRQIFFQVLTSDSTVLLLPHFDVIVEVFEGWHGVLSCHVVRDTHLYSDQYPQSEHLIGPIVDCHFNARESETPGDGLNNPWYKLWIPHHLKTEEQLGGVTVRHGNIHTNIPFEPVAHYKKLPPGCSSPNCYFEVNARHVVICTSSFSQFICTNGMCSAENLARLSSTSSLNHPQLTFACGMQRRMLSHSSLMVGVFVWVSF